MSNGVACMYVPESHTQWHCVEASSNIDNAGMAAVLKLREPPDYLYCSTILYLPAEQANNLFNLLT